MTATVTLSPSAARLREEVLKAYEERQKTKDELVNRYVNTNRITDTFALSAFNYAMSAEAKVDAIGMSPEYVNDEIEGNKLSGVSNNELLEYFEDQARALTKSVENMIGPNMQNPVLLHGKNEALKMYKSLIKFAKREIKKAS